MATVVAIMDEQCFYTKKIDVILITNYHGGRVGRYVGRVSRYVGRVGRYVGGDF
jgi:hypothetical protein